MEQNVESKQLAFINKVEEILTEAVPDIVWAQKQPRPILLGDVIADVTGRISHSAVDIGLLPLEFVEDVDV